MQFVFFSFKFIMVDNVAMQKMLKFVKETNLDERSLTNLSGSFAVTQLILQYYNNNIYLTIFFKYYLFIYFTI